MTTAPIGSMPKVSGMRIAIPADGPKPGMMPTTMPTIAPIIRNRRLVGVRATDMPSQRSANRSMRSLPGLAPGEHERAPHAAHHASPRIPGGIDAFSQTSNSKNRTIGRPMLTAMFCRYLPGFSTESVASM